MALSDDEKWILAENLKEQEKEDIAKLERGEDGSRGDFGSYYALLTGRNTEWVKAHAISEENYLASYIRQLRALLHETRQREELSILDVGCGPGFLTQKLSEGLRGSRVMGIDISESAIKYACRAYPACEFDVVSVDKNMDLGKKFDLVHAREFYPFTRTGDLDFQRKYIEILARHVAAGGILILTLRSMAKSLAPNANALAPTLKRLGMTPFRCVTLANAKIPRWVPLPAARAMTRAALRLAGRDSVDFYFTCHQ